MTTTRKAERRPFIKLRKDGGAYILVHVKGKGMRARQITPDGWSWIRDKYAADDFPHAETIPLTYADYWTLKKRGDIHTGGTPEPTPQKPILRPTTNNTHIYGLNDYAPRERKVATLPVAVPVMTNCAGCRNGLPKDARYCTRCGRMSENKRIEPTASKATPTPPPTGPRIRGWFRFVLLQVVVTAVVMYLIHQRQDVTPTAPTPTQQTRTSNATAGQTFYRTYSDPVAVAPKHTPTDRSYTPQDSYVPPASTYGNPHVAENGSYYGEISQRTGLPRTIEVQGYYRKDGTYVRGYYRSK